MTPTRPERVEIYDTTLRDGSQLEGISLTVEDKLRIAEQLDWLGVHYIEAGWPGANPKDDELFRRAPTELQLDDEHARRVRVDAAGQGQGRQRRHAAPPRRGERRHRVHRRQVVGLPRHSKRSARRSTRASRWSRDSVEFLRGAGHRRAVRRRALLRRLQAQPRVRAAGARRRGDRRARAGSCCATPTAARCRTRSSGSCARSSTYFGRDVGVAVHLHDDGGTGVANALAGVRGGAMQVQGTINGYGERTGNCNLTTIIPNLTLKMGIETIPRRPARPARRRSRTTSPSSSTCRSTRRRRTSGTRRSRTRPGCTRARSPSAPTRTSTSSPDLVGNGTRFVVSELAGQVDAGAEGEGARARARRPAARRGRRAAQAARARGLPLRSRRRLARAADAPRRRLASPTGSRSSRSA